MCRDAPKILEPADRELKAIAAFESPLILLDDFLVQLSLRDHGRISLSWNASLNESAS